MIKLYTFPPSTNSRKVRIALLEKGLEFQRINVDLSKREQKNPEYLKIHPFGQVPALDDEGFIIYDSTVINEYLEDEYPYPSLMPKDSEGRARARLMTDFSFSVRTKSPSETAQPELQGIPFSNLPRYPRGIPFALATRPKLKCFR